jgi:peptidoglycan/LPS O-acetylase OafA/YrhL
MLLGIALHAGMSYVSAYLSGDELVGWPFDPASSGFVLLLIVWIHAWRMQAFFMMAGFFAHLVVQRRGMRSFMKNRLHHVFLPFVLGVVIIVPLTIGVILYGMWRMGTLDQLEVSANTSSSTPEGFSPLHLWFLYYLLGFYLIIAGLYAAAVRLRFSAGGLWRRVDQIIRRVMLSRWRVVWLALLTVLPRMAIVTEDVVLFDSNIPYFIYSGVFFAFGWSIFRQPDLLKVLDQRRVWLSYLMIGTVVVMPPRMVLGEALSEQHVLYAGVYSLETWLLLFGMIGMFDALNARARLWVRYLADAAYWVYLMHMPLVALLSIWLIDLRWGALPKFMIVCIVSSILLLMTYQWGVRYTFIGRLLNGPRQRGELSKLAAGSGPN